MSTSPSDEKISPLKRHRMSVLRLRQSDIASRLPAGATQAWVSQIEKGQAALRYADERKPVAAAYELPLEKFDVMFEETRRMFMPRRIISAVNRRQEIPIFEIAKEGKGRPLPRWLNLAAGPGKELELCPDFIYVENRILPKNIHSAVIRGDSMMQTLQEGDVVILSEIPPDGRLPLPQIEDKAHKMTFESWRSLSGIQDDDICVVSIEDEAPTIKRVKYDLSRGKNRWKLQIIADNPSAWRDGLAFQAEVGDSVVFHARLMGRAEALKVKK